jgi:hypothetical protein
MVAVVAPLKVRVNVPPVGVPVIVTVCTSLMPVIAVSVEPSHCWTGSTPFVQ